MPPAARAPKAMGAFDLDIIGSGRKVFAYYFRARNLRRGKCGKVASRFCDLGQVGEEELGETKKW